jgi:L-threonylcarbamoyladenylate synthase
MNERAWLSPALAALSAGRVVAAPSESMFGLLADAQSPAAIEALLALKARSEEKGMPLLLPDRAAWARLVSEIPPLAARLADAFWPGALTIALPAATGLHERLVLGGMVAVRLPGPSPAAELASGFGRPLTATSANPPGEPATADPARVRRYFDAAIAEGRLSLVDVPARGGSVSTVVLVRGSELEIVRVGAIAPSEIERAAGA